MFREVTAALNAQPPPSLRCMRRVGTRTRVEHIRATPGWETSSWPDERSVADNLRDLQAHADDFENRKGFTYTVLDPATGDVIGCVYIFPTRAKTTMPASARGCGRAAASLTCSCGVPSRTGSRTSGRSSVWSTPSAPTTPNRVETQGSFPNTGLPDPRARAWSPL